MGTSRETARLSHRLRVFLVGLAAVAGMLVAGHCAAADAQAYSAYSDPGKTALSFVLSKGRTWPSFSGSSAWPTRKWAVS